MDYSGAMDIARLFPPIEQADAGLSALARGVVGSEILKIAAEIRALKAKGAAICNLTVGDFDPAYFPIPAELLEGTRAALAAGHTNYPPSDGVLALREAVARFYARELGLSYPVESVLVAGGARPLLYGAYRTLLDPGDVVVYPVPSWNNNHYAYLAGARAVELPVSAAENFFPTAEQIRPHLGEARLLCINSPLNPTGTVIDRDELSPHRRAGRRGERPPRARRGPAALLRLRPGLLDAHLRRHSPRHPDRARARGRALHDPPRRALEGVRARRGCASAGG